MQKRLSTKALVIGLILCCAIGIGATTVSFNGTSYSIPSTGETDWSGPTKVDGFLVSVASNALSKAGGNFTLTADVNFGSSFGLLAPYFSARTNAATTGFIRMDNGGSLSWRNAANSANLPLSVNNSNELTFNGFTILNSSGLLPAASGGTGIGSYTAGDTLYASGSTTLSKLAIGSSGLVMVSNTSAPLWQKITDAQVQDSAGISRTKLASGTADHVVINDGSGNLSSEAQVAVSRGGTNISSYTTGDLLYASGASTIAKLGIGSTGNVLKVAAGLPSWGSAGAALAVTSKTANYTITNTDDLVLANSSGGSLLLTLPSASANTGKVFTVKKTDSSLTCLGIIRAGADSIRDNTSKTEVDLCTQGEQYELVSDGSSAWDIIGHRIPSDWGSTVTLTPASAAFGSISAHSYVTRRVGDSLEVIGSWVNGTVGASEGLIAISTLTINTSKLSTTKRSQVGTVFVADDSTSTNYATTGRIGVCWIDNSDTGNIRLSLSGVSGDLGPHNGSSMSANSDTITYRFTIPISGWEP